MDKSKIFPGDRCQDLDRFINSVQAEMYVTAYETDATLVPARLAWAIINL